VRDLNIFTLWDWFELVMDRIFPRKYPVVLDFDRIDVVFKEVLNKKISSRDIKSLARGTNWST